MRSLFEYRFEALLHEVDENGVMFPDRLLRHAHDAYEAFLKQRGAPLEMWIAQGVRLPLVHAEAEWRHPIRHGQATTLILSLSRLGDTAFTLGHRVQSVADETLAVVSTTHVHLSPETNTPAPLPPRLRRLLAG